MNITKITKDRYRVRETYKGKTYSKYYHYKPSQREAINDMNKLISENNIYADDNFFKCSNLYINSKINILSPSTIRRYKTYMKSIPNEFLSLNINDIDKIKIQTLVNTYTLSHKPKTTKCFYGFVSSVIKFYTDKHYNIVLPQLVKNNSYIPTQNDINNILLFAKNTPYEITILLASYGLRIGEIMALTLEDIY